VRHEGGPLRLEAFTLVVVSGACAYLFYYVLATDGGYSAVLSAAMIALHLVFEWVRLFYKRGLKS
jgi:hypothetical protein